MTTETFIRHPADPYLYTDAMRSIAAADAAITQGMADQATLKDRLKQIDRQFDALRLDLAAQVAEEAAEAKRGTWLSNADGRDAEVQRRLRRDDRANELMDLSGKALIDLAACEVALDAAVRQRKGALASLAYASAYLSYLAQGARE